MKKFHINENSGILRVEGPDFYIKEMALGRSKFLKTGTRGNCSIPQGPLVL